jgi:surface protein
METIFPYGSLVPDISNWDTSNVTNMRRMFIGVTFNANISNWNTSNVTNMEQMFGSVKVFNQDISSWDTSNVTNMEKMFYNAKVFNQDISSWNTSNVNNMKNMFSSATNFNRPTIKYWIVNSEVNLSNMFHNNSMKNTFGKTPPYTKFNQGWEVPGDTAKTNLITALTKWYQIANDYTRSDTPGTVSTEEAAAAAVALYAANTYAGTEYKRMLSAWDVTSVTDMSDLFSGIIGIGNYTVHPDISAWDTSNVTNMSGMFKNVASFNQDINTKSVTRQDGTTYTAWNTSNVINTSSMFNGALVFDQDISSWNTSIVTDMSYMFNGATKFDQDIDTQSVTVGGSTYNAWDTSIVNDMSYMFNGALVFNGIISSWDTSEVTNMYRMFYSSTKFNQDISSWDTSKVTNMSYMFNGALVFDQDISSWDTSIVTSMSNMFNGATKFDQDINTRSVTVGISTYNAWDTIKVTDMSYMFKGALLFNQDISSWNTSKVADMSSMFNGALAFDQDINTRSVTVGISTYNAWDTSIVNDMSYMFNGALVFNGVISSWDTSEVTDMSYMFNGTLVFNKVISSWNTSEVTDMSSMFNGALVFNEVISSWNTSNVITMKNMFSSAEGFNKVISNWDTSKVTDMSSMFNGALVFNGIISNWDTSKVTDLSSMFNDALVFNGIISNWDTSIVTTMENIFNGALVFDQDISSWNTIKVTDMSGMFNGATDFNQDISSWDIRKVTTMENMFNSATTFNQDIGGWVLKNIYVNLTNMFYNTTLMVGFTIPTPRSTEFAWTVPGTGAATKTNLMKALTKWYTLAHGWNLTLNKTTNPARAAQALIAANTYSGIEYYGAPNKWVVTSVTDMSSLFSTLSWSTEYRRMLAHHYPAHPEINNWNTSNVTTMENMFKDTAFNKNIGSWDTIKVTTMENMFYGAKKFNQDISIWVLKNNNVKLTNMFYNTTLMVGFTTPTPLHQEFGWKATTKTNLITALTKWYQIANDYTGSSATYSTANTALTAANEYKGDEYWSPPNTWDVRSVTDMSRLFSGIINIGTYTVHPTISNWNTSSVIDMSYMFSSAKLFDKDISNWDTSKVTNMSYMFSSVTAFNGVISNWDIINVTTMENMFNGATSFDQDISIWDTIKVTNMSYMFDGATSFDQDIGNWDTRKVTDMTSMFNGATLMTVYGFSTPTPRSSEFGRRFYSAKTILIIALKKWYTLANDYTGSTYSVSRTAKYSTAAAALTAANTYNGDEYWSPPNTWDVRSVTNMSSLFSGFANYTVHPIISNWNTSIVTTMENMFKNTSFNQNIGSWDTSKVTTMENMFNGATLFDKDIGSWVLKNNNVKLTNMFYNTTLMVGFTTPTPLHQDFRVSSTTVPGTTTTKKYDILSTALKKWYQIANDYTGSSWTEATSSQTAAAALNAANTYSGSEYWSPPNTWDVRSVTDMSSLFSGFANYTVHPIISNWNTSSVIDMRYMFYNVWNFKQDISIWNTSNVTNMSHMFYKSRNFNSDISNWDTSKVTTMENMFNGATAFDQDISKWVINSGTVLTYMFKGATQMVSFTTPTPLYKEFAWKVSTAKTNLITALTKWYTLANTCVAIGLRDSRPITASVGTTVTQGSARGTLATALQNEYTITINSTVIVAAQGAAVWQGWSRGTLKTSLNGAQTQVVILCATGVTFVNSATLTILDGTPGGVSVTTGNISSVLHSGATTTVKVTVTTPNNPFNTEENLWISGDPVSKTNIISVTMTECPNSNTTITTANTYSGSEYFGEPNTWDVTSVTDMSDLFKGILDIGNYTFHPDISAWNTSKVTTMENMFNSATTFNQDIGGWNTSNVTNMSNMFREASDFNQDIGSWDTSNVTNMSNMFREASDFNQDINTQSVAVGGITYTAWDTSKVTTMENMFRLSSFNKPIDDWDTSNVTTMENMFKDTAFNQNIGSWDTSNVITMENMFNSAMSFNQNIGRWDTSNVTNMGGMFQTAMLFNKNIGSWNTSNVTNMKDTFLEAMVFNQDIINWDTAKVTTMENMLGAAFDFNQNISTWVLKNKTVTLTNMLSSTVVDGMAGVFTSTYASPSGPLYTEFAWKVEAKGQNTAKTNLITALTTWYELANNYTGSAWTGATTTRTAAAALTAANAYNGDEYWSPPNTWDVRSVTNMSDLFSGIPNIGNYTVHPEINNWNTSNVTDTGSMFNGATTFNQDISKWVINSGTDLTDMFNGATQMKTYGFTTPTPHYKEFVWTVPGTTAKTNLTTALTKWYEIANDYIDSPHGESKNSIITMSGLPLLAASIGATVQQGSVKGTVTEALQNEYTIVINSTAIVAAQGAYVSQGSLLGTLKTSLSGATTQIVILCASGVIFDNSARIYIGAITTPIPKGDIISISHSAKLIVTPDVPGTRFNTTTDLEISATGSQTIVDASNITNVTLKRSNPYSNALAAITAANTYSGSEYFRAPNTWDVTSVTDMSSLFSGFTSYTVHPDIFKWDTSKVKNMSNMFSGVTSFNQNLINWKLTSVIATTNMFNGTQLRSSFTNMEDTPRPSSWVSYWLSGSIDDDTTIAITAIYTASNKSVAITNYLVGKTKQKAFVIFGQLDTDTVTDYFLTETNDNIPIEKMGHIIEGLINENDPDKKKKIMGKLKLMDAAKLAFINTSSGVTSTDKLIELSLSQKNREQYKEGKAVISGINAVTGTNVTTTDINTGDLIAAYTTGATVTDEDKLTALGSLAYAVVQSTNKDATVKKLTKDLIDEFVVLPTTIDPQITEFTILNSSSNPNLSEGTTHTINSNDKKGYYVFADELGDSATIKDVNDTFVITYDGIEDTNTRIKNFTITKNGKEYLNNVAVWRSGDVINYSNAVAVLGSIIISPIIPPPIIPPLTNYDPEFSSEKNRVALKAKHPYAMRSQHQNYNKESNKRKQSVFSLRSKNTGSLPIHKRIGKPVRQSSTGSMGRLEKLKALAARRSK